MICGTFRKTGLDQATADLIAQTDRSVTPAPISVTTAQAADNTWTVTTVYPPCPSNVAHAMLNLSNLKAGQQTIAAQIASAFAGAGYGTSQQAVAVANAIAESSLNPMAVNATATEHSVGLFQLNMKGGLGQGHTEQQLQDPGTNISIILGECQKFPSLLAAPDTATANEIFVAQIERPADTQGEMARRLKIAESLIT